MRPDAVAQFGAPLRYDLRRTLGPLRYGRHDRTVRFPGDGSAWRATRTPEGAATGRYVHTDGQIEAQAWGPGAGWLVEHAPELLGLTDDLGEFAALASRHPVVEAVARRFAGVRLTRSLAVYETLLPAVLGQKVTGIEAKRAWAGLQQQWGEAAPSPVPPDGVALLLPPAPEVLAGVGTFELHPLGVERKRAGTLLAVARHANRLEEVVTMALPDAHRRMRAIPGIGVWTAAEAARLALGDADAVSVGDYHLPNMVAWRLAGEPRGDDERMLELLAPFAPHRGRVQRLLEADAKSAPKYGPRLAPSRMRWR